MLNFTDIVQWSLFFFFFIYIPKSSFIVIPFYTGVYLDMTLRKKIVYYAVDDMFKLYIFLIVQCEL